MENIQESIARLQQDYPFLTYLQYGEQSILGIIQNITKQFVMIYNFSEIRDERLKKLFLKYGDEWWYESNNQVPIDTFIGKSFDVFRDALRGYPRKEIAQIVGPQINLSETFNKRIKKRKIELVRPMPSLPQQGQKKPVS